MLISQHNNAPFSFSEVLSYRKQKTLSSMFGLVWLGLVTGPCFDDPVLKQHWLMTFVSPSELRSTIADCLVLLWNLHCFFPSSFVQWKKNLFLTMLLSSQWFDLTTFPVLWIDGILCLHVLFCRWKVMIRFFPYLNSHHGQILDSSCFCSPQS